MFVYHLKTLVTLVVVRVTMIAPLNCLALCTT
jgi:hypothetical protein